MHKIQNITLEEKDIKKAIKSENFSTDVDRLVSLTSGHEAFLRCLEEENFDNGKNELSESLFIFPHNTVWLLLSIIMAFDKDSNTGLMTFVEALNFYTLPDLKGADGLFKIGFKNRYENSEYFIRHIESLKIENLGLSKEAWQFLAKYPDVFSFNANKVIEYAKSIKANGGKYLEMGMYIEEFSHILNECDPYR